MALKSSNSRLVYSTDTGGACPKCGKPLQKCACAKAKSPAKSDGIVRLRLETKGRKGKGVTSISGLALPEPELIELAKKLKTRCGAGGTVKDGIIEIQGDHRPALQELLGALGYKVKLAGG